jgi:His/Glu/Gln/Arg/opine family amino acid ABC transporter permease subunit
MLKDIIAILDKYSYVFVEGIKWTLILTVITVSLGAVLGMLIAFLKMGKNRIGNIAGYLYIEVIRGTPILLQMYFFWLWLPKLQATAIAWNENITRVTIDPRWRWL